MSRKLPLPSYAVLTKAIQTYQLNGNAAQMHGLLCGILCANVNATAKQWEKFFPTIKKNKKVHTLLKEVIDMSRHQLNEFSFEFNLLLPNEKKDINTRAEALGLWCQGFLTGLKSMHVPIENRSPGEVTEVLDDIIKISEISFGDIAENDEDESAYFELVEYVRLSVLMIFQELKTKNPMLH